MIPNAYFRIIDPKEGGSWFFGQPHDAHGAQLNAQDFTDARRIEVAAPLILPLKQPGRAVDFSLSSFDMPVVSRRAGELFEHLAPDDVQRIPAVSAATDAELEILNVLHAEPCLDERMSTVEYFTKDDYRSDLAGKPRSVGFLTIKPSEVNGRAVFRIRDWLGPLIVSDHVREALVAAGLTGLRFERVYPPPDLPPGLPKRFWPPGRRDS